jgi:chromosome segregation ATPase
MNTATNYQESIVIPTLQKKLQEIQNSNLVLEVSLLIEQSKAKDSQAAYNKLLSESSQSTQDFEAKNQKIVSLKQELHNIGIERDKAKADLFREISVKESVMNEYNKLKFEYDNLVNQFNNLKTDNEKFKSVEQPKKTRKKQEPVEVMLDGETY